MRRLRFFSRVAFICNIFFVACFSIQLGNWVRNEDLESTIVMLGFVMGIPLNLVVNISYIACFVFKKKLGEFIPSWLIVANVLFLVIQILYFLYLNDTKYT